MIVVVADRQDETARALACRWAVQPIAIVTPGDLSVPGWQQADAMSRCMVVANGKLIPQQEIAGVLTRLPWIFEHDVMHIVPEDRQYVAAEMAAFLLFWLSQLKCPVLNRPTPTGLSGPYWRQEQWVRLAAQIGIPVRPVCRRSWLAGGCGVGPSDHDPAIVHVVGSCSFGDVDPTLALQARRLAEAAGVAVMTVQFSSPQCGACFINADLFPDLSDGRVADAVLEYLQAGCDRHRERHT